MDTVDEAGVPTHNILCPPPSILIKDSMGFRHHRHLRRTGSCPFCLGRHKTTIRDFPYKNRCRACLMENKKMNHKGNKHCCGLGVEGLPRDANPRAVVPVQIQPGSRAEERGRRIMMEDIAKMRQQDDLWAALGEVKYQKLRNAICLRSVSELN